ncbi:MAG: Ig-like domain-containing protein [Actinomycetota bacterium]
MTALLVGVLGITVGAAIVAAEGFESPDPELHDAGVWVTREDQLRVGRMNVEIDTIDISLGAGTTQFDVLQDGSNVFVRQQNPSGIQAIDPARAISIPGPELPPATEVVVGGGHAAVLTPDGALFVVPGPELVALDPADTDVAVEVFSGAAQLAMSDEGIAFVFRPDTGEVVSFDADGEPGEVWELAPVADGSFTVVGDVPVVLDAAGLEVLTPDRPAVPVDEFGDRPLLQEPGPESDSVIVSFAERLVGVPLEGEEPASALFDAGTGSPAVPIVVRGCAYGAWGGAGTIARVCGDDAPQTAQFGEMGGDSSLRFRTNREQVVLNELLTGKQVVWGDGDPIYVDYWGDAFDNEEPDIPECTAGEEGCVDVDDEGSSGENQPPIANDDEAGTRPGRAVVVRPLRNDVDPDGDVLVIEPIEPVGPDAGSVTVIEDGRALQVTVGPDRRSLSFPYAITDGNGHEPVAATVNVTVYDADENQPPEPGLDEETTVVAGDVVTHNVMVNAFEPEGDPMSVVDASSEAAEAVRFEVGGELTITAPIAPEPFVVEYVLADDKGAEATGTLDVIVVAPEANEPPDARSDYARATVGEEVVVDVLSNDSDANDDDLTVVAAEAAPGTDAIVTFDEFTSEVRVRSEIPGSVNVTYTVTDGQDPVDGLLRVDVAEQTAQFTPVAVRDEVLVSTARPSFVSVLDNDVDLDGDVLVITGVNPPALSTLSVDIVNREALRLTATAPLPETVEFTYVISDGDNAAIGQVLASPAPPLDRNQPPVVTPNEFDVRAGGVALLPVLVDDSDPDGDPLTLVDPPEVTASEATENGRLFVTGNQLRYEAPPEPKSTVFESYTVIDTASNAASAAINIHVLPADGDPNSPPEPPTLTGRTVSGGSLTIELPLTTMDPEADAVTFVGLETAPAKGIIVESTTDTIVYRADANEAGTDRFTYRVRDEFGLESTGIIRIGIAPRASANLPPVAEDDDYTVAPGTSAVLPVLDNDSDPEGDPIAISTDDADTQFSVAAGTVTFENGELTYTAPSDVADGRQIPLRYVIRDDKGATDDATVTIVIDSNVPNRPPEPQDDLVEPAPAGELVAVAVLDNDSDPDLDELSVLSVSLPGASIDPLTGNVEFVMPDEPTQFTYAVTDGIEQRRAAVFVPIETDGRPPVTGLDTATVGIGASITIPVLDNDTDPDGDDLTLIDVSSFRRGSAVIDGTNVVFTATGDDYIGEAGFAYRVADSDDPSQALTSIGFAQIEITGDINEAPTFTTLPVDIDAGTSLTVDLLPAVSDANDDDTHTFDELTGTTDDVTARIDGTALVIDAAATTPDGQVAVLDFTVDDGTATAPGQVIVTVLANEAPLTQTLPDEARTLQGQPVSLFPLDNDVNPFPGERLTLVGATLDDASVGTVDIQPDGQELLFIPAATRNDLGQVTFSYTVADATDDANRYVRGAGTITVIGRPDQPAAPLCSAAESTEVQLSWNPPAANGAPITEYIIRVIPDGGATTEQTAPGASTVQLITGLTNGTDYTFQVAAINEAVLAEPEFSPPSNRCRPDQVPDRPAAPVTTFGDGYLDIAFAQPASNGSPVTELILINTTTGESISRGPAETTYRWEGLTNGTSYRFQLVAVNDAGESDPSELSTGDSIPAGTPITALPPSVIAGDEQVTINWTHTDANNNGDEVVVWELDVQRAGVAQPSVTFSDGAVRTHTYPTDNGVEYRFAVRAQNKAGTSATSPLSDIAVSSGPPFQIDAINGTDNDTATILSFTEPFDNGAAILSYEYRTLDGGFSPITDWAALPGSRIIGGLNNGQQYHFQIRAINANGHAGLRDPIYTSSNTVVPYGNPGPINNLTATSLSGGNLEWTWAPADDGGRSGAGGINYEVSYDSGEWTDVGTATTYQPTGTGFFQSHTLVVRAFRSDPSADPARRLGPESAPTVGATGGTAAVRVSDTVRGQFPVYPTGTSLVLTANGQFGAGEGYIISAQNPSVFPGESTNDSDTTFQSPLDGNGCTQSRVTRTLESIQGQPDGSIIVTVRHSGRHSNTTAQGLTNCFGLISGYSQGGIDRVITVPWGTNSVTQGSQAFTLTEVDVVVGVPGAGGGIPASSVGITVDVTFS